MLQGLSGYNESPSIFSLNDPAEAIATGKKYHPIGLYHITQAETPAGEKGDAYERCFIMLCL